MRREGPPSPCDGCEKRHMRCHGSCKEYADYDAKRRQVRRKQYLEGEVAHAVAQSVIRATRKK